MGGKDLWNEVKEEFRSGRTHILGIEKEKVETAFSRTTTEK